MIIKHRNGTTRETTVRDCTGYIADSITLDGRDLNEIVAMFERLPRGEFAAWLLQLRARFPENRVPRS